MNRIFFLYMITAGASIILNLLFQYAISTMYGGGYTLQISILIGTLIGFFAKYILDKKYVFGKKTISIISEGTTIFFYGLIGLFTTLLFWFVEYAFHVILDLKYLGAIIGLSIGYYVKYLLDKKFIFNNEQ